MAEAKIPEWKILVVDDNRFFRQQLLDMLQHIGFQHIDQAANVGEALEKLGLGAYELVFLDLHMPGRSGYNFLQQCREDKRYDTTAFIVVSAEYEERYIREALKEGATAYIAKPVLPLALKKNLDMAVEWRALRLAAAGRTTP